VYCYTIWSLHIEDKHNTFVSLFCLIRTVFTSTINTSFLNSYIKLHEALILSIVQHVFAVWYLNASMSSDSGVVRNGVQQQIQHFLKAV